MIRSLPRALVYLRRIADALDRAYPRRPSTPPRRLELSVATAEDFEEGYRRSQQLGPDEERGTLNQ